MKLILKSILITYVLILSQQPIHAQEDKTVSLTVSGTGKTIEDAKTNALRSAIEQAFGAFISSKTEILNNKLISDQITSVVNGNIQSFKILNESQLPNGTWETFLNANVSIGKLISFVEAKGIAIEIKGGLFALNIKQQLLNEQGEINSINRMFELLHETMQISFDYTIKAGEPKSIDSESKNWEIPLMISATANKNMVFCTNYFFSILSSLSLSKSEVESYKQLNKKVFSINVEDIKINLRNENSIKLIKSLISNWEFYIRLFAINSGLDEKFGGHIEDYHALYRNDLDTKGKDGHDLCIINEYINESIVFPKQNQIVANISYTDKRTLSEIEQLKGYSVKPRGIVSNFKYGGYVLYEKNGHGLIVSTYDLKKDLTWIEAKSACSELKQNGFNDWRMPTKEELQLVYKNLFFKGIGNFYVGQYDSMEWTMYWTNEESNSYAWYLWFKNGQFSMMDKYSKTNHTRAVRSF